MKEILDPAGRRAKTYTLIARAHKLDRQKGLSEVQIGQLISFFIFYMGELAKATQQLLRQRVVATAAVYFQRFYLKHDLCCHHPCQVAPTCVYLAAKAEESSIQAKVLLHYVKRLAGKFQFSQQAMELQKLLDLEMMLLEELDFDLLLFHPYDVLAGLIKAAGLTHITAQAWSVLNDSYRSHVHLLYEKQDIAAACLVVACILTNKPVEPWLPGSGANVNEVYEISVELLNYYDKFRELITPEVCSRYLSILSIPNATQ